MVPASKTCAMEQAKYKHNKIDQDWIIYAVFSMLATAYKRSTGD
jgi:hypothetical protein